jgi:hypothetical protein
MGKMAGRPTAVTGQFAVLLTGTAGPERATTKVSSDLAPRTVGFQADPVQLGRDLSRTHGTGRPSPAAPGLD